MLSQTLAYVYMEMLEASEESFCKFANVFLEAVVARGVRTQVHSRLRQVGVHIRPEVEYAPAVHDVFVCGQFIAVSLSNKKSLLNFLIKIHYNRAGT